MKEGAVARAHRRAEYRVRSRRPRPISRRRGPRPAAGGEVGQAEAQVQTAASQTAAGQRAGHRRACDAVARRERPRALPAARRASRSSRGSSSTPRRPPSTRRAHSSRRRERSACAPASGVQQRAGRRAPRAGARAPAQRATRENAALQLSYTNITAPRRGMVSRKSVEVGQLVQPGQTLMSDRRRHRRVGHGELQGDAARTICASASRSSSRSTRTAARTSRAWSRASASATGAQFALLPPDNATGNFTKVVQRVPVRIRVTRGLGPDRPLRPGHERRRERAHRSEAVVSATAARPSAAPAVAGAPPAATAAAVVEQVPLVHPPRPHHGRGDGGARHHDHQRRAAADGGQPRRDADEIAWVSTSYILANVVVLPMTAFFTETFGRKQLPDVLDPRCSSSPRSSAARPRASASS